MYLPKVRFGLIPIDKDLGLLCPRITRQICASIHISKKTELPKGTLESTETHNALMPHDSSPAGHAGLEEMKLCGPRCPPEDKRIGQARPLGRWVGRCCESMDRCKRFAPCSSD